MTSAIVICLVVICLLLGAGGTALVGFGISGRSLPPSPDGKAARSPLWLAGGIGLLLLAIIFGTGLVIVVSQLPKSRASALVASGETAYLSNDFDTAMADFTEAIRIDPSQVVAFSDRAAIWVAKNEYDKARVDCDEAIRLNPLLANAFNTRALAWIGRIEYDKAIADCDEALRLDPKFGKAFNNRGLAWLGKGEYRRAAADLTQAVQLDPQNAGAHQNLAWLRAACADQGCRDGKEAVQSATKACDLAGWRDADRLAILAAAYAEAGDFEKAVEWIQKAIELGPKDLPSEWRFGLELYKAHKPIRQPDVRNLADCVWAWVEVQTQQNLLTLMASFKASRVGVGIPPDGQPIPPARKNLAGGLKWVATSTLPDGKRFLIVLTDVKNLAKHEPRSRFAEVAGSDVIQLAITEQSGIAIQILTPGRAAYATIPKELVERLGRATPQNE
jgi:tetratricopeptide (TPR) repeat protein